MGRIVTGSPANNTPLVLLKKKVGSTFTGVKIGQKSNPKSEKAGLIFEFSAVGGDAFIGKASGKKIIENGKAVNEYESFEIEEGDKVSIFGDTQLNDKLDSRKDATGVNNGDTVTITFLGFKLNEKSGRSFADYQVEVA